MNIHEYHVHTFIFQKLYHDIKIKHVLHKKSTFTNNWQGVDILLPTILNLKNIYNSSSIKKWFIIEGELLEKM